MVECRKSIIVFGASGFIASHLLEKISHFDVTCVVRSKNTLVNDHVEVVDYDDLAQIQDVKKFDFALDFASNVSVENIVADPLSFFFGNLEIPLFHLKFLKFCNFKGHYVLLSTDRALVPNSDADFANDIDLNNDPYGASKYLSELICNYGLRLLGAHCTVIRLPNIYGIGQTSKQLLPTIINRISNGETEVFLNSFSGNRNYLHVEDAVDAIRMFLEKPILERSINVSGENVEILYLINKIKDYYEELTYQKLTFTEGNSVNPRSSYLTPPATLDDSKFRNNYDWQPRIHIDEGIKQMVEFGVKNG